MTISKTLTLTERANDWALKVRVTSAKHGMSNATTTIATFSKRPMALLTMAAAVNATMKNLMVDSITLTASEEGMAQLNAVGILEGGSTNV